MKKRILIAALSALLACGVFAGCGAEQSNEPATTSSTATPENNAATPSETNEPSEPEKAGTLSVGDSCEIGSFKITVTDFSYKREIKDNEYYGEKADEGSIFAVVNLKVKNISNEPDTFASSFPFGDMVAQKIIYDTDYTYSEETFLAMDNYLQDEKLNPLESKTGYLAFSVPEEIKNSKKPLVLEFKTDSDSIQYNLR